MKNNHFYYLVKLFFTSHKLLSHNSTDLYIPDNSSSSQGPKSPPRKVGFSPDDGEGSPKRSSKSEHGRMTPVRLRKVTSFTGSPMQGQFSQFEIYNLRDQIESVKSMPDLLEIIYEIQDTFLKQSSFLNQQ